MRIENPETKTLMTSIGLALTRLEAAELRDSLNALLDSPRRDRHEHVSSQDFQREITLWIDDES